jgi:hypothetical protein
MDGWVSGGKLAVAVDMDTPDGLRQAIVDILQAGETVTSALKRLRPAPGKRPGAKRDAAADTQVSLWHGGCTSSSAFLRGACVWPEAEEDR